MATQTSKKGKRVLIASPWITLSLRSSDVPSTRLSTSRTMRVSYSMATTDLDCWRRGTVMFPVPGPISRMESVGLRPALATIAVTTAGFLRKCWPREVLGAMRLVPADLREVVPSLLEVDEDGAERDVMA